MDRDRIGGAVVLIVQTVYLTHAYTHDPYNYMHTCNCHGYMFPVVVTS